MVSIDTMPAGANRLALNGETLGKDIPGEDVYRALLRIRMGGKPVQDSPKADLLMAWFRGARLRPGNCLNCRARR